MFHEKLEIVASSFVAMARVWGLTVSLTKSKVMVVGTDVDAGI